MSSSPSAERQTKNLDWSTSSAGDSDNECQRFASVDEISDRLSLDIQDRDPVDRNASESPARVTTRILSFGFAKRAGREPVNEDESETSANLEKPPIGWLAVIDGPGRGQFFSLIDRVSRIGRGDGHDVNLSFGDEYISRDHHASIVYAPHRREFELHDRGRANPVRLNNEKIIGAVILRSGDIIEVGTTKLRFVALCDRQFAWETGEE